jgi:hypothetical protein
MLLDQVQEKIDDSWRNVWQKGIAPQLSLNALKALRQALRDNDPKLIQGATMSPPPLACVEDWPVEAACGISFGPWRGDGIQNVGELEAVFAELCCYCDQAMGEPGACRWFIGWYDDAPRDVMRQALLPAVEQAVEARERESNGGLAGSAIG